MKATARNGQATPDQIREARNAYQRAWRKANPEKVQAAQARFYARRLELLQQAAAQHPDQ